jgi:hypothetical protein
MFVARAPRYVEHDEAHHLVGVVDAAFEEDVATFTSFGLSPQSGEEVQVRRLHAGRRACGREGREDGQGTPAIAAKGKRVRAQGEWCLAAVWPPFQAARHKADTKGRIFRTPGGPITPPPKFHLKSDWGRDSGMFCPRIDPF